MNEADLELVLSSTEDEDENNTSGDEKRKEHSDTGNSSSQDEIPEVIGEEKKEDDIPGVHKEETAEYFQQFIFLQAGDCEYAPHTAHCLLLDKATVLIVISQVDRYFTVIPEVQ